MILYLSVSLLWLLVSDLQVWIKISILPIDLNN